MKRQPKGYGSVSQLPSGKWLTKVPVGKTSNGKTRYKNKTCTTKSDARRWQTAMISMREQQMLVAGPRQTLRHYASDVLLNSNDRISDRTRDGYFRNLRKHVFPVFGHRTLSDIKSQELESFFSQLRNRYSASTVNNVRLALSKVYTVAIRHGVVLLNPVVRTEKARRKEMEKTQVRVPWSEEEALLALEAAQGTPFEAFLTLALATGMRRGELLGLQWSDIDFDHQLVAIERTIHRESITQLDGSKVRGVIVAPPKTANSRRINQLTVPVLDVLRLHECSQQINRREAGESWEESGYVFTNSRGGPLDESNHYKRWVRFLKKSGIRYIRIHDIRHSFATILIEEDAGQLASVSKALGHSSIAITMDIYAKTAQVQTQATSRMSEILFPGRGSAVPIFVPDLGKISSISPGRRRAS